MITPEDVQDLNDRDSCDLRQVITLATGVLAFRSDELAVAELLERLAARLRGQARKAAA